MKIFLLLMTLSLSFSLWGSNFTNNNMANVKSPHEVFLDNQEVLIKESILRYKLLLSQNNIPLNLTNLVFSIENPSIDVSFSTTPLENIAQCNQKGENKHISFSKSTFESNKNLDLIVWHELSHCLYNVKHNLRNPDSIMFPLYNTTSKKNFSYRKELLIHEIKLTQFNPQYELSNFIDSIGNDKYINIVGLNLIDLRMNLNEYSRAHVELALNLFNFSKEKKKAKEMTPNDHRKLLTILKLMIKTK